MLKPIEKFGLERSLYAGCAVALAAVLATTIFVADRAARETLGGSLRRRGEARVRLLATELEPAVARDDAAVAAQELQRGFDPDEGVYAVVLRADGSVLARRVAPGWNDASERLVSEHLRHAEDRSFDDGAVYGFIARIPTTGEHALGVAAASQPHARVLLGFSSALLDRDVARVRLAVGLAAALGVLGFAAVAYAFVHRLVFRPILEVREVARRVSERDLRARAPKGAAEEVGSLAESLNRIGENLTGTLSRVNGVADAVSGVIARVGKTGSAVAEGVGTVSARVVDTGSSMGEMIASLKGIAANVEVLAQSAEQSSSSILEMAATNDEVAENIQSLAASVAETTAAIEEMTFSIKEVAKNIEDLSATAEETSASMNQIDLSISQVETNANETAKLSEQAQKDAESGAEALSRTLAGIDKIKDSSKEAASVIEALGKKIATIDTILNVIDDVAEQTNLLALNAAILAAQSGEHGKGFAVVADEIKDLAERTGASTKEISEVVRSVQDESKNAVLAMDRGVKNVEEGVRLGQDAETALKKIQESSQKSTQMVKAIARATIEQARGSKQVTMAINRIAETVQQIATATAEQAKGSEQIMKSAEKMKIITKHVERSSQEQARGSKQVTKAIESISEMVNHLNRAQKEQTKGSEQVMTAVVQIKKVAEAQTDSVRELEAALIDLAREVDVLADETRTFKI